VGRRLGVEPSAKAGFFAAWAGTNCVIRPNMMLRRRKLERRRTTSARVLSAVPRFSESRTPVARGPRGDRRACLDLLFRFACSSLEPAQAPPGGRPAILAARSCCFRHGGPSSGKGTHGPIRHSRLAGDTHAEPTARSATALRQPGGLASRAMLAAPFIRRSRVPAWAAEFLCPRGTGMPGRRPSTTRRGPGPPVIPRRRDPGRPRRETNDRPGPGSPAGPGDEQIGTICALGRHRGRPQDSGRSRFGDLKLFAPKSNNVSAYKRWAVPRGTLEGPGWTMWISVTVTCRLQGRRVGLRDHRARKSL